MSVIVPSHIKWSINSIEYGDYSGIPTGVDIDFKFEYSNLYDNYDSSVTFKQAVRNKLASLSEKKLAICVSGVDSELLAREAVDMGLNVELFFLKMWDINQYIQAPVVKLAEELNVKLNIVEISREAAWEYAALSYMKHRVRKPTYLLIPYLLDNIDESYWPIVCEGDMNKDKEVYLEYMNRAGQDMTNLPETYLMTANTEIVYWLWAKENNREGDFYFYSSTPELVTSAWNDEAFELDLPGVYNRNTLSKFWNTSSFIFAEKTTNWDSNFRENLVLRYHLDETCGAKKEFEVYYDLVSI